MMRAWQVLHQAIPRGECEAVALRLKVEADTVRRWKREPLSTEAPEATGRRSPLDFVTDLIDAIFLANPAGAHLVVNYVREHYARLAETHALTGSVKSAAALALSDMVRAVNAINLEEPAAEIEARLAAAEGKLNDVKRHARVMHAENGGGPRLYGPASHMRNAG